MEIEHPPQKGIFSSHTFRVRTAIKEEILRNGGTICSNPEFYVVPSLQYIRENSLPQDSTVVLESFIKDSLAQQNLQNPHCYTFDALVSLQWILF